MWLINQQTVLLKQHQDLSSISHFSCFLRKSYPLAYILMSFKIEADYNRVFYKLKEITELDLQYAITDFEKVLSIF